MPRLPNSDRAILDIEKIENYCLNSGHPRGRHKARVFKRVLGINRSHATWLRSSILLGIRTAEAVELVTDEFGTRWQVDVLLSRHGETAMIRTIWIVLTGSTEPRFVTCWVL